MSEEKLIERPVSEEQCDKLGGHYWNHYDSKTPTNEFGERTDNTRYLSAGLPRKMKTCGLCGKTLKKQPVEWKNNE